MAKSHPALLDESTVSRAAFWARNPLASLAALVSIASLAVALSLPSGGPLAALPGQIWGALELPHLSLGRVQVPPPVIDPSAAKYRAIGEHLAQRFRVSADITTHVVAKAYDIGHELKLDPLLILAVIAVESRFNPIAESVMGAKGLMQVIPRFHPDKFAPLGGEQVAFDPAANITVGAKILNEYLRRAGDLNGALRLYVGASSDETVNGYPDKVMAERERLYGVLRQHNHRAGQAVPQAQTRLLPSAI